MILQQRSAVADPLVYASPIILIRGATLGLSNTLGEGVTKDTLHKVCMYLPTGYLTPTWPGFLWNAANVRGISRIQRRAPYFGVPLIRACTYLNVVLVAEVWTFDRLPRLLPLYPFSALLFQVWINEIMS